MTDRFRPTDLGSLHQDICEGSGQDLATCNSIAVYSVGGWWKRNQRKDRLDLPVRYALLVSLKTSRQAISWSRRASMRCWLLRRGVSGSGVVTDGGLHWSVMDSSLGPSRRSCRVGVLAVRLGH